MEDYQQQPSKLEENNIRLRYLAAASSSSAQDESTTTTTTTTTTTRPLSPNDYLENQITIVILTADQKRIVDLKDIVKVGSDHPYVEEVVIIWNNPTEPEGATYVRNQLLVLQQQGGGGGGGEPATTTNNNNKVRILQSTRNSLNNRFDPNFLQIRTGGLMVLDDDVTIIDETINCVYESWIASSKFGIHIFGSPRKVNRKFYGGATSWETDVNFILPRMLFSTSLLNVYSHANNTNMRQYVDTQQAHCDDIAFTSIITKYLNFPLLAVPAPLGERFKDGEMRWFNTADRDRVPKSIVKYGNSLTTAANKNNRDRHMARLECVRAIINMLNWTLPTVHKSTCSYQKRAKEAFQCYRKGSVYGNRLLCENASPQVGNSTGTFLLFGDGITTTTTTTTKPHDDVQQQSTTTTATDAAAAAAAAPTTNPDPAAQQKTMANPVTNSDALSTWLAVIEEQQQQQQQQSNTDSAPSAATEPQQQQQQMTKAEPDDGVAEDPLLAGQTPATLEEQQPNTDPAPTSTTATTTTTTSADITKELYKSDDKLQISRQNKVLFVHVPKTGGSGIEESSLFDDKRRYSGKKAVGHYKISEYFNKPGITPQDYRSFAMIRHPCERFVSAFHYMARGGRNKYDAAWTKENIGDMSLEEWVLSPNKGIQDTFFHFWPMWKFVFLEDSETMGVDDIFCQEQYSEVTTWINNNYGPIFSEIPFVNKGSHKPPGGCENLSAKAREAIEKFYELDYCVFGYKKGTINTGSSSHTTTGCLAQGKSKKFFTARMARCKDSVWRGLKT